MSSAIAFPSSSGKSCGDVGGELKLHGGDEKTRPGLEDLGWEEVGDGIEGGMSSMFSSGENLLSTGMLYSSGVVSVFTLSPAPASKHKADTWLDGGLEGGRHGEEGSSSSNTLSFAT